MNEIKIAEIIRELRNDKGISQETLADICDVSMQAVSKWENGQSCPDITFLPLLAEYFEVSTDYLLTGRENIREETDTGIYLNLPEQEITEDTLYILQYRNGKIIDRQQWDKDRADNRSDAIRIRFDDQIQQTKTKLYIEVWGDANIEAPDTSMDLNAGANINCGTVKGNINAGSNVCCDTVAGNVNAGSNVNCTTIKGNVSAGCSITCESIGGNAKAGMNIEYIP